MIPRLILIAAAIIAGVIYPLIVRIGNPQLTEMQLFLKCWAGLSIAFYALIVLLLIKYK